MDKVNPVYSPRKPCLRGGIIMDLVGRTMDESIIKNLACAHGYTIEVFTIAVLISLYGDCIGGKKYLYVLIWALPLIQLHVT